MNNTPEIISIQKKVAANFREELLNFSKGGYKLLTSAYLAGGAPRDWHFGKKARDLDFYIGITKPASLTKPAIFRHLLSLLKANYGAVRDVGAYYTKHTNRLLLSKPLGFYGIFELKYRDSVTGFVQIIQLICFSEGITLKDIFNSFDTSICEMSYNFSRDTIEMSKRCKIYLDRGLSLTVNDALQNGHIDRVKTYYPDIKFVPLRPS